MPDHPNLALVKFLRGFEPCDTDELWSWVVVGRLADTRPDLPANPDELKLSLAVLKAMRYVAETAEKWSLIYPQPRERVVGQQELNFA